MTLLLLIQLRMGMAPTTMRTMRLGQLRKEVEGGREDVLSRKGLHLAHEFLLNPLVKSEYIFSCTDFLLAVTCDLLLQAYSCHLSLLVENLLVKNY